MTQSSTSQKYGWSLRTDGDLTIVEHLPFPRTNLSAIANFFISHVLVFILANCYVFAVVLSVAFPVICIWTGHWGFFLAFLVLYLPSYYDRCELRFGRIWPAYNQWRWLWNCLFLYFPIRMAREGPPFDPKQQYMFCVHPHGAIGWSHVPFMVGSNLIWDQLFPGLQLRVLGARVLFRIPILRELYLWMRCVDASKRVAVGILRSGINLSLTPGGIAEQMETEYGRDMVWVKERYGFARLALELGVHIVPVYAFGEIKTYHTVRHFAFFRQWMARKLKFTLVFPYGRLLLLPHPTPITIVVGRPIATVQNPHPTDEQVRHLLAQYTEQMKSLFAKYREEFGGAKDLTVFQ